MNSQANQLKQQTFSKGIVYGTISYQIGANKRGSDKSTHKWCVYVRGPNGEDLSTFIEKIVFVLHETFPDYQRGISKPPFEVVEKGWGEFDILIQIHFKAHYPHLELVHKLKLYGAKTGGNSQSSKKPVVSEFYDEIVFVNPSVEFSELLQEVKYLTQQEEQPEVLETKEPSAMEEEVAAGGNQLAADQDEEKFDWKLYYLKFDAAEHHTKLQDALAVVKLENEKCTAENEKQDKEIEQLQKEVEQLQKQSQLQANALKAQQEKEELELNQKVLLSQNQVNTTGTPTAHSMNNGVPLENNNINPVVTDNTAFQPQQQPQQQPQPQYYPASDDRILQQQQQTAPAQQQQLIQNNPRQPSNIHYIAQQSNGNNNINNPQQIPSSQPPQENMVLLPSQQQQAYPQQTLPPNLEYMQQQQ